MWEYKLIKIGVLKYKRLEAMSILKRKLKSFDFNYSFYEIKEIFDLLLTDKFDETFDGRFKFCLDCVFNQNEYQQISIEGVDWSEERNFPDDYVICFC